MVSYKHRARLLIQRLGYDVLRYPQSDSMWKLAKLLNSNHIDLVVDVGANDGGYGRAIRRHGYLEWIESFEPLVVPFGKLSKSAAADPKWGCHRLALGDNEGSLTMNVAGNDGASSSALPMLERHVRASPESVYVGIETVDVRRLDDVADDLFRRTQASRVHLKMDVQGYEMAVLRGASRLLESPRLVGLQMELSLEDLYQGGMRWQEGFEIALHHEFRPMAVMPGFSDFHTGQTLQFDVAFMRPRDAQIS